MEYTNPQNYLSFASTDPPLNAMNPRNEHSGITTPLSTLVGAARKEKHNKKSPTCKNFPYLRMQEGKQDNSQPSGVYSLLNESKIPQRPLFSQFLQQPGGQFDPKSIDFSALQLPNTPPKTSRNKKNLHKTTSSTPMSLTSSVIAHNQQR